MGKARISAHRIMSSGECTPQPEHTHRHQKIHLPCFPFSWPRERYAERRLPGPAPGKVPGKIWKLGPTPVCQPFGGAIRCGMSRSPRWEGPEAATFEMGVGWAQNTCHSVAQHGTTFQRVPGPPKENYIMFMPSRPGVINPLFQAVVRFRQFWG